MTVTNTLAYFNREASFIERAIVFLLVAIDLLFVLRYIIIKCFSFKPPSQHDDFCVMDHLHVSSIRKSA